MMFIPRTKIVCPLIVILSNKERVTATNFCNPAADVVVFTCNTASSVPAYKKLKVV